MSRPEKAADGKTQNKRGGAREGAGRPSQGLTVRFNMLLSQEEREALTRLGGAEWVRQQIRRAAGLPK